MRPLSFFLLILGVGLLDGAASAQPRADPPGKTVSGKSEQAPESKKLPPAPAPCFKHLDGQLLVFAVNGAGGGTTLSDNLLDVNEDMHLGLRMQMVPWARHNAVYQDLIDHEAQIKAAARIACSVQVLRKDAPNAHIFFIAHSAGARVVLAAAEMLPPKSIDRIIVIAPAVTANYDLTTALKATRYGLDNFFSPEDRLLETVAEKSPLADGARGPAAGRIGFRPCSSDQKTLEVYRCQVRQYKWNDQFHGNGGHFAWVIRHNMKKVLPPLFCSAPVVYEVAPPPVIEKKVEKK
jgi:hypothetical protein